MADMSLPAPTAAPAPVAIPLRQILPWAAFAAVIALVLLYFVGVEQGVLSVFAGETVHEFVHDGRHLLGFPCH
ncbi:CbtB domain-containing protein [Micromonospora olivasterospora]|uniref:Putative cobalt transporter subunit CbtB n=1 Tax=Micromonospora olivasterospora TaxID=1880 RepID=A0A562I8Q6_MICOL|nr:CbtB domain-containing protein [Micromonospora olivasterospora]TWH67168.1 putative cobalt transporter subunit CbtB [Micromonospora olivasterospora]